MMRERIMRDERRTPGRIEDMEYTGDTGELYFENKGNTAGQLAFH